MKTAAAHQRILRTVPRMTGGAGLAGLAVIASLVLQLSGASMAAEPRATLPSAAADRTSPRRLAFEIEGRSMRVFGVRSYQPSVRRVYQPAALPERGINKKKSARWQAIATLPDALFDTSLHGERRA
jgi:hypothetical protein